MRPTSPSSVPTNTITQARRSEILMLPRTHLTPQHRPVIGSAGQLFLTQRQCIGGTGRGNFGGMNPSSFYPMSSHPSFSSRQAARWAGVALLLMAGLAGFADGYVLQGLTPEQLPAREVPESGVSRMVIPSSLASRRKCSGKLTVARPATNWVVPRR